jgi:hypothetical protein
MPCRRGLGAGRKPRILAAQAIIALKNFHQHHERAAEIAQASCIFCIVCLVGLSRGSKRCVGLRSDPISQAAHQATTSQTSGFCSLASDGIGSRGAAGSRPAHGLEPAVTSLSRARDRDTKLRRMAMRTARLHVERSPGKACNTSWANTRAEHMSSMKIEAHSVVAKAQVGRARCGAGADQDPGALRPECNFGDAIGATTCNYLLLNYAVFQNHARSADRHATAANQGTWIGSAEHCHVKRSRTAAEGTKRKTYFRTLDSLVSTCHRVLSSASREATTER